MNPLFLKAGEVKRKDRKKDTDFVAFKRVAGLSTIYIQFDKDGEGEKHEHPDGYEIIYLLSGQIEFLIETTKRKYGEYVGIVLKDKGDIAYLPAGSIHRDRYKKGTKVLVIRSTDNKIIVK